MLRRTVQRQAGSNDCIMAVFVCERGSLCVLGADVVNATQSSRLLSKVLLPEPKITSVSGSDTLTLALREHKKANNRDVMGVCVR